MRKQIFTIFLLAIFVCLIFFSIKFLSSFKKQNYKILNFSNMKLNSVNFKDNSFLPPKYTCDGLGINPDLQIDEVPTYTKSLALILEDPDAPSGMFAHWLMWNIAPDIKIIKEGLVPTNAIQGLNDYGKNDYGVPCPPQGTHRYIFKVYALDITLENLSPRTNREKLLSAINGHVLGVAQIVSLYSRGK